MLRLAGGQVESLWDEVLPCEVRALPGDLAGLDVLLSDAALLEPIVSAWQREALAHGRPTMSMATFVRLMVIKQRTGWGYETLMRERLRAFFGELDGKMDTIGPVADTAIRRTEECLSGWCSVVEQPELD